MSAIYLSRWTFAGIQLFPFAAGLLVNVPCEGGRTTVVLCGYDDAHPVRITEAS
jgi:hypothetical protein